MASAFRDRTSEFRSLTQTLKRIEGITSVNQENVLSTSKPHTPPLLSSRADFNKKAYMIRLGIHEAAQKIARLAKLAKRSSTFDDPSVEIQKLTALINGGARKILRENNITTLNRALTDLQTLQNMEIANGNYSQDSVVHSTAVCDDLKSKLIEATKDLQDVSATRTENMKAHENRKQIFSSNASRKNPFARELKPATEPPPWSNSANAFGNSQQSGRRAAVDNTPSHHMEMSMLQQVVPRQDNYAQSRAVALHNAESTISVVSGIFTHLATMVAQQGELAIRIDDNMDESLANVENARNALLRHLNQISSNRWLLIKIFAVIIIFLMVFIIFVA